MFLLLAAVPCLTSCERAPEKSDTPRHPEVFRTAAGDEMVVIPAGRFRMGSDSGQADERPGHEVQIDSFLMDRYEITQKQWVGVKNRVNGSKFKGDRRPAEMISWVDAATYCNDRSEAEGLEPCYYGEDPVRCNYEANGYRLPTEAEWEYACRAGATGTYAFGDDPRKLGEYAWFAGNAGGTTHPVGQKKPNAWGLYDMHGNVAEWCNDVYAKDYYAASPSRNPQGPARGEKYVLRGGAWGLNAPACRASCRAADHPGFADRCFPDEIKGFRCVRRLPAKGAAAGQPKPAPQATPGPKPSSTSPATQAAGRTGFVYDKVYLGHDTGRSHPERPGRLTAIVDRLTKSGLRARLVPIPSRPAAAKWLTTVHSPAYVARVKKACAQGPQYLDSRDTPVSKGSWPAALHAAGGVLAAVDAVMAGKVRNAFCAVRPPGHHALKNRAMGFCLFNNVAVAARYIQRHHKLARVLIVDWDVHHGNGTQAMFYEDATVFYFGVHRSPFYPGTGTANERGKGAGRGTTLNVPLPAGSGDRAFIAALTDKLVPAMRTFRPDFILISAGFDAHEKDPLGGMKVTAKGYAELTRILMKLADEYCRGRLVSVLEGGYSLEGLAASCEAHVRVLATR